MHAPAPPSARQRGVTLLGLLFWGVILAFAAIIAMKVFPTVNEYFTVQRAVEKVANEGGGTVAEVRRAFDKTKEVEYSITSLSGKDLEVSKDSAGNVVVEFAYDKEIEIMDPVYILIKYQGSSKK